jgi:hypothetical protein
MTKLIEGTVEHGSAMAFTRYIKMLERDKFKPLNHTLITEGDPTHPEHLLWMCHEALKNIHMMSGGMSVDKYSRWLGYVQGCLIMQNYTTVEKERDITRPWLAGKD